MLCGVEKQKEVAEEGIVDAAAEKKHDGVVAVHTLEQEDNVFPTI
ncbi:hypothetical protein A2U01_0088879, partial [Trifolium medium]|nr:hypothetical protein [Trifolium medium]